MVHTKDTFYIMLRDRLAALNPARTVVVRGITRPGILVEENEFVSGEVIADVFRVRWPALKASAGGPLPLTSLTCEIRYATAGSVVNGGMDRGRLLAQMDAELSAALCKAPQNIVKSNYAAGDSGGSPVAMGTNVFWGDAMYGAVKTTTEMLERVTTVDVFSYQEVGE